MFDCITAVQCWQYMDSERAIPAFQRILKPGGHLAVDLHCLAAGSKPDCVQRSIETVRQFNPDWNGYDRRLQYFTPGWCKGGIHLAALKTLDAEIPFTRETWNGRMRACRGVGASLPPEQVESFSKRHRKMLEDTMPEKFFILHEISILNFQFP